MNNKQTTNIFVIGPIGEMNSDTRKIADELRKDILEPAAEEAFGADLFTLERADDLSEPGRISLQVLQKLIEADVAIVDLTGLNANVMYELGVRQARLKPYVLVRPAGQPLPFDVMDIRAVDYDFTLGGGKRAIKELADMLRSYQKSISTTDELLFGATVNSFESDRAVEQRLQVQMLDQLSSLKETMDLVAGGVIHLMQSEERQRQDMAEYRQQELGVRIFEVISNQSDPQAMIDMIQQFAALGNQANQVSNQEEPAPANRVQRRQSQRRKT